MVEEVTFAFRHMVGDLHNPPCNEIAMYFIAEINKNIMLRPEDMMYPDGTAVEPGRVICGHCGAPLHPALIVVDPLYDHKRDVWYNIDLSLGLVKETRDDEHLQVPKFNAYKYPKYPKYPK